MELRKVSHAPTTIRSPLFRAHDDFSTNVCFVHTTTPYAYIYERHNSTRSKRVIPSRMSASVVADR